MRVTEGPSREAVAEAMPLPRPGDTVVNRLVARGLGSRPVQVITEQDVDRWLAASLDAVHHAGGDPGIAERIRAHRAHHWVIAGDPGPPEVWCGEVLWPHPDVAEPPAVRIYPDSPWGRLPAGVVFETASQTGIDHIVSHLFHYFSGQDFSEEVACTDEVRLMWSRPRLIDKVAAMAILLGVRLHKQVSFSCVARELRTPLTDPSRRHPRVPVS